MRITSEPPWTDPLTDSMAFGACAQAGKASVTDSRTTARVLQAEVNDGAH
jgi:hypothetical protein